MKGTFAILLFLVILIVRVNGQTWEYFDTSNSPIVQGVTDIEFTAKGRAWIGMDEYAGVAYYENGIWHANPNINKSAFGHLINDIEEDKMGVIWFGCDGAVYSLTDTVWKRYDFTNSKLPRSNVWKIKTDKLNNKWLSTDSGLFKFDGVFWTEFNTNNSGLHNDLTAGLSIDTLNRVWVVTAYGVDVFDGNSWLRFDSTNSPLYLTAASILSGLVDSKNRFWIDDGPVYVLEDSLWTELTFDIDPGQKFWPYQNIYEDLEGGIWIGGLGSVLRIKNGSYKVYKKTDGLNLPAVYNCAQDPNTHDIWFAGLGISILKHPTALSSVAATQNSFDIYPNPASDYFSLKVNKSVEGKFKVNIYNSMGEQIQSKIIDKVDSNVNVTSYSVGIYFVKIQNLENQSISITKLIVSH